MRQLVLAAVLVGCGSPAAKMDGPLADVKNSDGYQHVVQRLAATKAKTDTAEVKGNEMLDDVKKYAGDREDTARHYTTERITKPLKWGDDENNAELRKRIDELEAKSDGKDAELAQDIEDFKAAQALLDEMQQAEIDFLVKELDRLQLDFDTAKAELDATNEEQDEEFGAALEAQQAEIEEMKALIADLQNAQESLRNCMYYLSYRLFGLSQQVSYNSYSIYQLRTNLRGLLRQVGRLSRQVRANSRQISSLRRSVNTINNNVYSLFVDVADLESRIEDLENAEVESCSVSSSNLWGNRVRLTIDCGDNGYYSGTLKRSVF
jgi:chromosome segregation ATPase